MFFLSFSLYNATIPVFQVLSGIIVEHQSQSNQLISGWSWIHSIRGSLSLIPSNWLKAYDSEFINNRSKPTTFPFQKSIYQTVSLISAHTYNIP